MNRHQIAAAMFGLYGIALALPAAAEPLEMAQKAGCMGCHAKDRKLVGPAFADISAKYKGQGGIAAKLAEHVRKGSTGVWGSIAMPPSGPDKIGDADLKTVVEWMLKG
ncbi:MAG: cytochrome C [Zoogloea sp.]|nr:cytochrome C [Zoogloea sp.]